MNVSCPACATVFRVDPAKVPEGGVRARCSACGGVIAVGITAASEPPALPRSQAATPGVSARPTPAAPFVPRQTPASASPRMEPATPAHAVPTIAPPVRSTPAASVPPVRENQPVSRPTPPMAPRVTPISVPAYTPAPLGSQPNFPPQPRPAASSSQ
ncbi:MAG: zinc-ribbon domain-containing protein, partial [Gemmatimonadaceae bacterium]|nr:zinc-ribbon domain-containing protein [Gemmatimonadaceae bacterium]